MAEYQVANIFRGAYWWLSDDIFTGIQDSFYSGMNCEIRDNAKGLSISKAMVKENVVGTPIAEKFNVIVKTGDTQWVAFGNSWSIYIKVSGWGSRTKATTSTPAQPITWAAVFWTYLYRATTTKLHRILTANIHAWASESLNRQTLTSSTYHPLLATSTILTVGNGNKVSRVGIAGDWLDMVTLESNTVVKIINEIWGTIRLYTSKWQDKDIIYLWDWIKTDVNQTIPLEGFRVYQAIIFNGMDYIVTNKGLGYFDWYKRIPIKKITWLNSSYNSICVHNEKIYIGWTWGIYVFGNKNKNYPEVMNIEYYTSNWSATDVVWAMTSDWTNCFVSRSNGSTYGIDLLSDTTYWTSAYYISRGFYGNSLAEVKWGMYIRVGFKPLITGQSITISYSLNWWAYTALTSITSTSDKVTSWTTKQKLNGQFQYINFKIALVWPWTSTPEFYTLDFYYDTMLD